MLGMKNLTTSSLATPRLLTQDRNPAHQLPHELTERIIDHLHDNVSSLLTCTLVHRLWSSTAQWHLSDVPRYARELDGLEELYAHLQSFPATSHRIRHLVITNLHDSFGHPTLLYEMRTLLPGLESLCLRSCVWSNTTERIPLPAGMHTLHMEQLFLTNSGLRTFLALFDWDLPSSIGSGPRLILHRVNALLDAPAAVLNPRLAVKMIDIVGCETSELFEDLLHTDSHTSLEHLEFQIERGCDPHGIELWLRRGHALKHISFYIALSAANAGISLPLLDGRTTPMDSLEVKVEHGAELTLLQMLSDMRLQVGVVHIGLGYGTSRTELIFRETDFEGHLEIGLGHVRNVRISFASSIKVVNDFHLFSKHFDHTGTGNHVQILSEGLSMMKTV